MTYKPRWKEVYAKANEFLVLSKVIDSFPFSTTKFIKELSDISFCSFSDARKKGIEPTNYGSDSAFLSRLNGRHIIFFNDGHVKHRIQFSILHEFAHFILNHDYDTIDEELYGIQEAEANYFAAQILMPEHILRELVSRELCVDSDFIMHHFSVSEEAAIKRIDTLNKIRDFNRSREEVEYDDIILMKYSSFIDEIKSPILTFEYEWERQQERDSWY